MLEEGCKLEVFLCITFVQISQNLGRLIYLIC